MFLFKKLLTSLLVLFVLVSFFLVSSVGASSLMWSQTYGGTDKEVAYSLVSTYDGGYALLGIKSDGYYLKDQSAWLIKVDKNGSMEWNRSFANLNWSSHASLVETSDDGFVITSARPAYAQDKGNRLVKTDAYGNVEWSREYSTDIIQDVYGLIETSDGGYAMVGSIFFPSISGYVDYSIVKTNANGIMQWSRTYAGNYQEYGRALVETSDGGFAIACELHMNSNIFDFLLVKTDKFGYMEWNQTYTVGQAGLDLIQSSVLTSDGGFALGGSNVLVKTDADGNMEWNQSYGGYIHSLIQISDGGYVLAGEAPSGEGHNDCWLAKTDDTGNIEWSQTYGGTGSDGFMSLVEAPDGGYAILGNTDSFGAGETDFWLIKTDEYGTIPEFPSWTPLLIALVAVVTITFVYRHKLKKQRRFNDV